MFKTIRFIILALVVLVTTACGPTATSESTGEYFDSSATTAKVKARLVDMLGAKAAMSIKVRTWKNNVQLSGFVNNNTIRERAGIIADNTFGVKQVSNNLIVK
jgi:osmotically-inducible protein OsmY